MIKKSINHLRASKVGYFTHFFHAWGMNVMLIKCFIYSAIHSVIPGMHENKAEVIFMKMLNKQHSFKNGNV